MCARGGARSDPPGTAIVCTSVTVRKQTGRTEHEETHGWRRHRNVLRGYASESSAPAGSVPSSARPSAAPDTRSSRRPPFPNVPEPTPQSACPPHGSSNPHRWTKPVTWSCSPSPTRSEEHTSELHSRFELASPLLLEKKK